jgi:zinc transport system substrate-binding protein
MSFMRRFIALLVLSVALPAHATSSNPAGSAMVPATDTAAPMLLATIRPLQLIAIAVIGDPARVGLLIEPGQSHHDYQLRPSDRQRLQQADLVLWIGPTLEGFLQQPMARLPAERVVMLGDDIAEAPGHHHPHDDEHHHHPDGHPWLDPERAIAMAVMIADRLAQLTPAQAERWQRNARHFAEQLRAVDAGLKADFAALPAVRPYLVVHDAYAHFERHYGLQRAATWAATPEQQPGARHLLALQRQIDAGAIGCIFTEPQFEPRALKTMTARDGLRQAQLDLMAERAPLTVDGFVRFFADFGRTFALCLQP